MMQGASVDIGEGGEHSGIPPGLAHWQGGHTVLGLYFRAVTKPQEIRRCFIEFRVNSP